MRNKKWVIIGLLISSALALSCVPSYRVVLKEQIETGNVTPITFAKAEELKTSDIVVTFVLKPNGISVDSVVNIGSFHKGAEADIVYLVRNETDVPITPVIYFAQDTRIDGYSVVEGQGFKDAPSYVEDWIEVNPKPSAIPPYLAQGYLVSLTMPEDADQFADKWAFQVGVAFGGKLQLATSPWWLVTMK